MIVFSPTRRPKLGLSLGSVEFREVLFTALQCAELELNKPICFTSLSLLQCCSAAVLHPLVPAFSQFTADWSLECIIRSTACRLCSHASYALAKYHQEWRRARVRRGAVTVFVVMTNCQCWAIIIPPPLYPSPHLTLAPDTRSLVPWWCHWSQLLFTINPTLPPP